MNEDLKELFKSLKSQNVKFIVIGAHALAFHGRPRMTQDVDLWVDPSPENAKRLAAALEAFGAPIGEEGISRFSAPGRQLIRLGVPPNMVDILNFAGQRPFAEVSARGQVGDLDGEELMFPSKDDLIEMKKEASRPQDLVDIENLK